jgi:hypothetical protein
MGWSRRTPPRTGDWWPGCDKAATFGDGENLLLARQMEPVLEGQARVITSSPSSSLIFSRRGRMPGSAIDGQLNL